MSITLPKIQELLEDSTYNIN